MHTTRKTRSFFSPFLVALAVGLALTHCAHAETPAATGTPPPAATAPAVETPAPTAPAGQQEQTQPAATRRKEEEVEAPATPSKPAGAPAAKGPSIFERAAALVRGKDELAATIAGHEKTIVDLRATIAAHEKTIAAQLAELGDLRAGKQQIEAALATERKEKQTVAETVAGLGFPAAQLPGAQTIEEAGDTVEGLTAQFRAETDPVKRSEIAARLREMRKA